MDNVVKIKDHLAKLQSSIINDSAQVGETFLWDVLDYEPDGTDNTAIIFSLWTGLIISLYLRGWTKEDLAKELDTYHDIAKKIEDSKK